MKGRPAAEQRQHGVKGVYYGGEWLVILIFVPNFNN